MISLLTSNEPSSKHKLKTKNLINYLKYNTFRTVVKSLILFISRHANFWYCLMFMRICCYRFTTYQDARRVRLVDGLIFETNILRVSPVKFVVAIGYVTIIRLCTKFTCLQFSLSVSEKHNQWQLIIYPLLKLIKCN